jgi:hypothetical protein
MQKKKIIILYIIFLKDGYYLAVSDTDVDAVMNPNLCK